MVAASRRAARPVNSERAMRWAKPLLQRLRQLQRSLLGFNLRQIAEVGADACDQPTHKGPRRYFKLLKQRFLLQLVDALHGNVGYDHILSRGEANISITVLVSEARNLGQLVR